jgi:hypothetical protein
MEFARGDRQPGLSRQRGAMAERFFLLGFVYRSSWVVALGAH